ncbi:hypothetical protein Tco_1259333 [Tanacetum coccineum]
MKIKLGHTHISDSIRSMMFKEWENKDVNFEVNIGRTKDDPYSRNFDVYKDEFDKEIEQLVNEYELKARRKRYDLEEVWENVKNFMIQPNSGFLYKKEEFEAPLVRIHVVVRYGYIKNDKKTVKNEQARTRESREYKKKPKNQSRSQKSQILSLL